MKANFWIGIGCLVVIAIRWHALDVPEALVGGFLCGINLGFALCFRRRFI